MEEGPQLPYILPSKQRELPRLHNLASIVELRNLAIEDSGFGDDSFRLTAWPFLLGCGVDHPETLTQAESWNALPVHDDEAQVQLDVDRAFVYYPKSEGNVHLKQRKGELSELILTVLRRYPQLHYFQGYHDVAQVLLLVLGSHSAVPALAHLSFLHVRDFMLPSLGPSVDQLQLVPSILSAVHPQLSRHISATPPVFALSATLTMYAHHIQQLGEIARLFDFLLAGPAVLSLYFFVTIVSSRSEELLEIEANDPATLHSTLSKIPGDMDLEQLIKQTSDSFTRYPPESFPIAWAMISRYSALKTTRWGLENWTIEKGEQAFKSHAAEINRQSQRNRILTKLWTGRASWLESALATSIVFTAWWFINV